jgi:chromate reductase
MRLSMKVVGISGSLRKGSFNTGLLKHVSNSAPDGVEFEIADISEVPLFNQDMEKDPPQSVEDFKELVSGADAILFASPEYNHGISGVLKNAIDWLSRPPAESAIKGKPCGLMGASPSFVGTARGQEQLKLAISGSGAVAFRGPHVLVNRAGDKFDDNGNLTDEDTVKFVDNYVEKLVDWAK